MDMMHLVSQAVFITVTIGVVIGLSFMWIWSKEA